MKKKSRKIGSFISETKDISLSYDIRLNPPSKPFKKCVMNSFSPIWVSIYVTNGKPTHFLDYLLVRKGNKSKNSSGYIVARKETAASFDKYRV